MDRQFSGNASPEEAYQDRDKNLHLGPCFDLNLSASEAIKLFDQRSQVSPSEGCMASDKSHGNPAEPGVQPADA